MRIQKGEEKQWSGLNDDAHRIVFKIKTIFFLENGETK